MKEKKDCKIIQDLLPNYIEKLTNEETNRYVEEHLKECEDCSRVLANMQKDIETNTTKVENEEVNYIKKFSHKMKFLKIIIAAIIIIYVIIVCRRALIMTSLSKKANQYLYNENYYAKLYSYQGNALAVTESYIMGQDCYFTTMTRFGEDKQIRKLTYYKKNDEEVNLMDFEDNHIKMEHMVGGYILPVTYVSDGFLANLQYALFIGIDSTYCNGKECYVIKGKSYERYIDKETGLAVRDIEKSSKETSRKTDMVVDYEYKFNVVQDSDIVKPDITGYKQAQ